MHEQLVTRSMTRDSTDYFGQWVEPALTLLAACKPGRFSGNGSSADTQRPDNAMHRHDVEVQWRLADLRCTRSDAEADGSGDGGSKYRRRDASAARGEVGLAGMPASSSFHLSPNIPCHSISSCSFLHWSKARIHE